MVHHKIFTITVSLFLLLKTNINGQSNDLLLTKENASGKISEVYHSFNETENPREIEVLLSLLKKSQDLQLHDTIKGKLLYLKGQYHFLSFRNNRKADSLFQKSFEYALKTKDHFLIGMINNDRGVINAYDTKDYHTSEKLYLKAVESYKKVKNIKKLIEVYYNLMVNSIDLEMYNKAIRLGNICLDLIDKEKDYYYRTFYLRIYSHIARCYIQLNDFEKAEEYLQTLEVHLKNGNFENKFLTHSWFYVTYADLDFSRGDYISSVDNLKKSIKALRNLNTKQVKTLNGSFDRELTLEKEVRREKETTIEVQRSILLIGFITIVLLIGFVITLTFLFKINNKKKDQIVKLNNELNELIVNLKDNNVVLEERKREIENLLKLNEQSLFTRILKISVYNDTISKISNDIDSYMDSSPSASGYLMTVRKKLKPLISENELWENFKIQFEKVRPEFFNRLKEVAPSLSVNDLKHCTYIVSNLKSKEVAQLINVSPRSVETTRYRIKKKLGLNKRDNLYDLLNNL